MVVGLRVVRGPDWNQGDKDGGAHHVGTVTAVKGDNDVEVQWDMGERTVCRAGKAGKHDLRIFDSAPLGFCHAGEVCAGCEEAGIAGTRWRCKVCDNVSLCTPCYFDDSHDMSHVFVRIDYPGVTPVQQSKRSISQRARAFGIYPNAEVTRGIHWEYANQDGGAGAVGVVEDVVNYGKDLSQRNAARVRWPRGGTHVYRLGYKGRVDLKCKEETPGADYYPEHLACITQAMLQQGSDHVDVLKIGDTVCVHVTKADFRRLQQGRLVWNTRMEELCGETGIIKSVTIEGDVEIDFGDDVVTVDKSAIDKVPSHKKGDVVRVIDSKQKIQRLQRKHGGWDDGMEEGLVYKSDKELFGGARMAVLNAVGKLGRITVIDADGDVGVAFADSAFVFHPACLVPAPGQTVPGIPDEDSDEESEEETTPPKPAPGDTGKPENGEEEEEEGEGMDFLQMFAGLMLLQALSGEAGPNIKERFLHAVVKDQADDVTVLLREHPELKEMRHNDIPILNIGAHTGNVSVIRALLDAGANIDIQDEKRNTPLHVAITAEKGDATRLLIERGCTVNVFNTFKRAPLHIAAHKDMPSIVRLLVANGADPNAQDAVGDTPLHDAISERRDTVATILIDLPAMDLWLKNAKHFNSLAFACLKAHSHAVDKLISREPRLVSSPDTRAHVGFYPIHIAAVNNHINEANILLIKGRADVNAKNDHNVTPLHLAASEGYYDMAKLLLTHEADWTSKDRDGDTALHLCLGGSRTEGMFLRLLGLRSMAEDNDRVKIANLLIQHGADLHTKNKKDRNPIEACDNPRMREAVLTYAQNNKPTRPEPRQARPRTAKAEKQMFQSSTQKCHKCCQELADTRFLPCRDTVACRKCCFKYKRCPVCSKEISKRVSKDDNTPIAGDSCSIS